MDELLSTIKEVQEGGKYLANWYLEHGYVLLDIQSSSQARKAPDIVGRQYYIRKNPIYILGRPEGVQVAPPLPKWERPDKIPMEDEK
jgi:hypothetical protein